MIQLCMDIPSSAPDDLNTFIATVNNVPPSWTFPTFSVGRNALADPAAAILAGGNEPAGLKVNLQISNGQFLKKPLESSRAWAPRSSDRKRVHEKLKLMRR